MDAFGQELTRLYPYLRSFAHKLTKSDAEVEDLVQETLTSAWDKRSLFVPGTNMRAWACTILRNRFYTDCRKQRLRRFVSLDDPEHPIFVEVPGNQEDRTELRDVLAEMDRLPLHMQEALNLAGTLGYSYEEAAEVSGVPEGTIKSRVCRARKALAKELRLECAS